MDKETRGSRGTREQLIPPNWIGEPVIVESLAPVTGYQLGVQIFGGNVEEATARGVVFSGTAGRFTGHRVFLPWSSIASVMLASQAEVEALEA